MIQFRLLGALNLLAADGRELRAVLAQPKRVALLAYLAVAWPRRFYRRDSLLALLWPELDQEHARAALRQAIHGLRKVLGNTILENRGDDEIGLSDDFRCDAAAFDEAAAAARHSEALSLYRGDLLDGFFLTGAPEFERWLEDERARLRRQAVKSAWTLAESSRDSGDVALASHWGRQAAGMVRDDEGSLRRLVALLADIGDRAGALQAYDAFASRLAEEYEAQPSSETRALIAEIRARQAPATSPRTRPNLPSADRATNPDPVATPVQPSPAPADDGPHPAAPTADDGRHAARPAAPHPAGPTEERRGRPLFLGLALAVVLFIATLGAALAWNRDARAPAATRVVVAGFANRTGDSTLDALSELGRDEITRGLALTEVVELADPGMAGISAAASAPPGQEAAAARALALETDADLVVRGAVYRRGAEVEFVATLADARSGMVLRTFDPVRGSATDPRAALTTLRNQVMVVVAEAVDPRLGASASASAGPPRYDAYEAFVTGVGIWYDGRNGRDALPHFKRSAALDSTFALPLIWAAWVHQTFGQCDSTEAIARRLATLALSRLERVQIDRQMARCHGDLEAAYRLARVLADARPHSEVWQEQLARDALDFERPREAMAILDRLHPDRGALRGRATYYNFATSARHLVGQHKAELEVARLGRERFPGNLAVWRTELLALAALRRGSEVLERLDEIDALANDPLRRKPTVLREIALDLAAHGDSVAARAALSRTLVWHTAQPQADQASEFHRYERALTHYAAGHSDSARTLAESLVTAEPQRLAYVGLVGALAARRGDRATASAMDEQLALLHRPYERGQSAWWRSCIAAQLGRRDEAVSLLRRALAEGYVFNGLFFLNAHLEPSFAPLRGYAPFEDLLRPKG